jgi:DNA helicase-2/ATP-dependent DNA helicase PcrA
VRGGGDFLERPEVRRAMRVLRDTREPLGAALRDLQATIDEDDDPEVERPESALEQQANVEMLVRLGYDFLRLAPNGTAGAFAAWLAATIMAEGPDGTGDAVDLATFHAAKGLEWSVVHLAGVEDGFVPISHARTAPARAEEARLLYVAMTRAERQLCCTWATMRTFGARTVERRLSPLLEDVADQRAAPAGPPSEPTADWRERLAEQRALLAAAEPPRSSALEALRQWRADAARAARIEPGTLLGDHLLEAIAALDPSDHAQLRSVPGMGEILVARFGDAMLAALSEAKGA